MSSIVDPPSPSTKLKLTSLKHQRDPYINIADFKGLKEFEKLHAELYEGALAPKGNG
jgi:hypothetical protein